jgi:molybdopterin-dependent oxidoreductase alpha subunit
MNQEVSNVDKNNQQQIQPTPKSDSQKENSSDMGGGLPIIQYWAEHTLSSEGIKLWQTLLHNSACLSCAWGTGGQKGGFTNEDGEKLQRCMKSVEAISAEIQPPVNPNILEQQSITQLQQLTSQGADRLGRWSCPLVLTAESSHYQKITWDEIYQIAETAFKTTPERVASYSSGRSSNEAAFLLQLMMRALGSNNLADCSDLCHAPSTFGLKQIFGTGTSMVSLKGLKESDCLVLAGSNAAYNHPRLMNELIKLRERGGKVIVINPVREVGLVKFASPAFPVKSLLTGSDIASIYLQPIPGSDVALFVGIQKSLSEQNQIDREFLQKYTENWQEILKYAEATSWSSITETCGIAQKEIEMAASMIASSSKVVFAWAMGITQQQNGVDNVSSIANTALITGNVGRFGTGLMPIRGHSNVQGFGSMGVTIRLKQEIQQSLEKLLGCSLSRTPGYDAQALIEAADAGKIDTLICVGGNLYGASPDSQRVKRALGKIRTIIYLATKPNLGHFHGLAAQTTIIVPVFNRFENPHKTTVESGNNYVRLNDEGQTHLKNADLIAEVDFLTELAHRLHGEHPLNWRKLQNTEYVRELIAQTIPGYGKIANIDRTKEEFTIEGRIFNQPKFPTPSGKATIFLTPLPQLTLPQPEDFGVANYSHGIVLALMTGRGYGQHNTVVYQTQDKYRGIPHRHCILMNPLDAENAGLQEHQRVTVKGNASQLDNVEIIYGATRLGSALMFYPEVNVIFNAPIESRCGTPAFKRVPVFVYV